MSAAARTWRTSSPPTPRSDPSKPPPTSGCALPTATTWSRSAGSAPPQSIEVRFGTSRAGAVDVALYTTASVDAAPAGHPEVDWAQLR
ncbi:hypothetical protein [Streptomyces sp. NRRL S-1022]|uniref:hypothetical protein n=1 Tax=Streptomyces sp. NRRL S-1022 TaxID=1463880 RepID=UPI00055A192C|nr:hypothetical protein [Streptomyces sp. NRRL S-1022]